MSAPVNLDSLSSLSKEQIVDIVNGLKINPLIKSVVLGQIKRAQPDQLKIIMDKVQTMIQTIKSNDPEAIEKLRAELAEYGQKSGLPEKYINGLVDLVK